MQPRRCWPRLSISMIGCPHSLHFSAIAPLRQRASSGWMCEGQPPRLASGRRLVASTCETDNELLTMPSDIAVSRLHIERRTPWVLSCSNVPRREVQYRLASKPSQSAFAGSPKHGWWSTVRSVGSFTERRFGLTRKRRLTWLSRRYLLRTNEHYQKRSASFRALAFQAAVAVDV